MYFINFSAKNPLPLALEIFEFDSYISTQFYTQNLIMFLTEKYMYGHILGLESFVLGQEFARNINFRFSFSFVILSIHGALSNIPHLCGTERMIECRRSVNVNDGIKALFVYKLLERIYKTYRLLVQWVRKGWVLHRLQNW